MKIVLVIPSCNQNRERTINQINNLKGSLIPEGVEFIPIFLFGRGGNTEGIPYKTMVVDVEEKYSNIHFKYLEGYKRINEEYDFDFIFKIDDDTKINFEKFKKEWVEGKDYVGRFVYGNLPSKIILELDCFNLYKTIHLNPSSFETCMYKFVSGECCFFSKKAIEHIYKSKFEQLDDIYGLIEDRMFGYMLQDDNIIKNDIKITNDFTTENDLQVTEDYFTIHPINELLYKLLIGLKVKEQLEVIKNNQSLNLLRRKTYLKVLEDNIRDTVMKFLDSKKTMGLG